MPLLTVWQLNLASAPPNFGTATGTIPAKQQATPQRAAMEFVLGRGFFMPQMSTVATEPLLGQFGDVPQYPYVFAVDQTEVASIAVGALTAGASTTISTYISFALPAITLDPTDNATLLLIEDVWQNPITPGLVIASVQLEPQALTSSSSTWVSARTLQGGQTYTTWRCQATIGLVAVTATAAATLHLGAFALLTVLPQ